KFLFLFVARLPLIFGFHKSLQVRQARLPEDPILLEPRIHRLQWLRIELIKAVTTLTVLRDQVRLPQQAKVLGNGRSRNGKCSGNLPCRCSSLPQKIKHSSSRWIGKRAESRLSRICNRTVTHNA